MSKITQIHTLTCRLKVLEEEKEELENLIENQGTEPAYIIKEYHTGSVQFSDESSNGLIRYLLKRTEAEAEKVEKAIEGMMK